MVFLNDMMFIHLKNCYFCHFFVNTTYIDVVGVIKVEVVDGKLQVKARRSALEKIKRVRPMADYSPCVKSNVLIVGGG